MAITLTEIQAVLSLRDALTPAMKTAAANAVKAAQSMAPAFVSTGAAVEKFAAGSVRSLGSVSTELILAQRHVAELNKAILEDSSKGNIASLHAYAAMLDDAIPKVKSLQTELGKFKSAQEGTNQAGAGQVSWLTKVNGLLGGFGAGLSIGAVVGFGKALLASADALEKLHDKTGVSLQALQKFQIVGDDAGNSIEQITMAISQMENRLASGDDSAIAALGKLGISFDDLKKLSPEDQFVAISDAIRKVEDPSQRTAIAMDLFGRTGAEVLPTLTHGFDDVKNAAVGMSDHTIKALDRAGDSLAAYWRSFKGAAASGAVAAFEFIASGFNQTAAAAARAADAAETEMARLQKHIDDMAKSMQAAIEMAKPVTGTVGPMPDMAIQAELYAEKQRKLETATKATTAASKEWAGVMRELNSVGGNFARTVDTIDGNVVEGIRYYLDAGVAQGTLAKAYGLTATHVAAVGKAMDAEKQAVKDSDKALEDFVKTTDAFEKEGVAAATAVAKGFAGMPNVLRNVSVAMGDTQLAAKQLNTQVGLMPDLSKNAAAHMQGLMQQVTEESKRGSDGLHDLAGSFADLAQISGDSFGGVLKGVGQVIGAIDLAKSATEQLSDVTDATGKTMHASWSNAAQGALTYVGIAMTVMDALSSASKKRLAEESAIVGKYLDTLRQIQAAGGEGGPGVSDAQRLAPWKFGMTPEQLQNIGVSEASIASYTAAYDRWIAAQRNPGDSSELFGSLTQLTGAFKALTPELEHFLKLKEEASSRFGPSHSDLVAIAQDAHEVFDSMLKDGGFTAEQLTAAFLAFQKALAASGNEAAQVWLKTQENATKGAAMVDKALADLRSRRESLAQSIAGEAPEEVMGVIEAQTRGQMSALDAMIGRQEDVLALQAANVAADIEKQLGSIKIQPIVVPYEFQQVGPGIPGAPSVPTGFDPASSAVRGHVIPQKGDSDYKIASMAAGGSGHASGPMLFYTKGNEDFAFSGEGQSFGGGGTVVVQVDARQSFYDDPASVERLANKVGEAVMRQQRRSLRQG